MKLRNKKTGKIIKMFNNTDGILPNTLAELNEEWEDASAEPLIKDGEIRKAVRAWAKACDIPNDVQLDVFEYLGTGKTAIQYTYEAKTKPYKRCVQFEYISSDKVYNSQNDRKRTVTELCGEENE